MANLSNEIPHPNPLLTAKFCVPLPRPSLVPRLRSIQRLDEDENDPDRFAGYLTTALRTFYAYVGSTELATPISLGRPLSRRL